MYGLTQTVAPVEEPLSVAEAKSWLRVDFPDDDTLIGSLISAARRLVERAVGRQLVTATWKLTLPGFPGYPGWYQIAEVAPDPATIWLPRAPLQSVTSVQYLDLGGALQTLTTTVYDVDATQDPGVLCLAQYQIWPITRIAPAAVRVTYVAGYGAAAAVPDELKQAMRMTIAHWYENREAVVTGTIATQLPLAVESLLMANWNGQYT